MPVSGYLVTAGGEGNVKIWDYSGADVAVLKTIRHHDEVPKCLAIRETVADGGRLECCLYVGTKEGTMLKCDLHPNLRSGGESSEEKKEEQEREKEEDEEEKAGVEEGVGGEARGGVLNQDDEEEDYELVDSEDEDGPEEKMDEARRRK
jgi:hypothetical protein